MKITPQQQIVNLIKNKDKILLISHRKPDGDAIGSVLALYTVLRSIGKDVLAVSSDSVPDIYNFMPNLDVINTNFKNSQDFIITLDCAKVEVDKLKYNLEDNKVNIVVSPLSGSFSEKEVSFSKGESNFDLIIVLDSADLEQIGRIYEQSSDLFFSAPVINIDHHASNIFFGNVNLVDITAASTTEILFEVIQKMEKIENKKLITEDVATLLLTGIITDTGSFQNPNTTPKSFDIAAELIDFGARQQEIIQRIYKTKKVSTLKLWGHTLSKIKVDPVYRMVWSTITKNDLDEVDAVPEESDGIIDELMSNAPGAEIILLLKDNLDGVISGSLRTTSANIDASKIAELFGGGGHLQASGFKLQNGKNFDLVLADVLKKIKTFQANRLNLPADKTQEDREIEVSLIEKTEKKQDVIEEKPLQTSRASRVLEFSKNKEIHLDKKPKSIDITEKLSTISSQKKTSKAENQPLPKENPLSVENSQKPPSTQV